MVDTELAAGRLARPLPKRVAAKASQVFALTWRDAGRNDQRIAAFRDFALDEACGCELAAGPCGIPPSERDSQMQAVWIGGRATRRTMTAAAAGDVEPESGEAGPKEAPSANYLRGTSGNSRTSR